MWVKQAAGKLPVCPYRLGRQPSLTDILELPQYLLESGWASDGNVIACTQPRRVAATSVASRVASEVGTVLGDKVRFRVPNERPS